VQVAQFFNKNKKLSSIEIKIPESFRPGAAQLKNQSDVSNKNSQLQRKLNKGASAQAS